MSQRSDRETTVPVESPSDTLCEDHSSTVLFLRGEQIKQLISAGISDIAVIVGYLKEKFDYLTD